MRDARYGMMVTAVLASTLLASCAVDLGKCDQNMLGGSMTPGMEKPNAGQVVVNTTCAGGRCHASTATGKNRVGVPAGLNFDVLPMNPPATQTPDEKARVMKAASTVHDKADSMWAEIDNGSMPPQNQGRSLGAQDKETLRNWLACGSPVINAPVSAAPSSDWTSIYPALTDNSGCLACHSAMPANNHFVFGPDACTAYKNVVSKPASAQDMCASSGLNLVMPMQPDMSLLVKKLEGTPPCGMPMPLGSMGLGATNPTVIALRTWIMNGAMPPPGCM